ncbi:MAG TPA: ribonuclease D [Nevskiales bacterium]|nr:ribonuclease D [Nevskiales bacterium]
MSGFLYLDTPAALAEHCARLRGRDWLAVDTEFIRERTYYPQLCLVQVSDGETHACIDPLRLADLGPLLELLYDPAITKVFHAAGQDLELFYHLTGKVPGPVFDTQLAATLAGFGDQVGYARLVQDLLGVTLDKAHTRCDWSRRPLAEAELAYAADDVRYLCQVYAKLRAELAQRGRLDWLAADFAALSDPARYENLPEDAWARIGAAHKLRPNQQKLVRALAAWREQQARRLDRPRRWILADDVLLDLARRQPKTLEDLARLRGLPEGLVQKQGAALLAVLANAAQAPAPAAEREAPRLAASQQPLLELLQALVHAVSEEQAISPAALTSRRELERLILGERELPVLSGWRRAAIGEPLLKLLEGRAVLRVKEGRVRLSPAPG